MYIDVSSWVLITTGLVCMVIAILMAMRSGIGSESLFLVLMGIVCIAAAAYVTFYSNEYIAIGTVCDKIGGNEIQIDSHIYYVDEDTYASVCMGENVSVNVIDVPFTYKTASLVSAPHVGCCSGKC